MEIANELNNKNWIHLVLCTVHVPKKREKENEKVHRKLNEANKPYWIQNMAIIQIWYNSYFPSSSFSCSLFSVHQFVDHVVLFSMQKVFCLFLQLLFVGFFIGWACLSRGCTFIGTLCIYFHFSIEGFRLSTLFGNLELFFSPFNNIKLWLFSPILLWR